MRVGSILILFILSLVGCGKGVRGPKADQRGFETYVARFDAAANAHGIYFRGGLETIPIGFGTPIQKDVNAECQWNFLTGKRIVVVEKLWPGFEEPEREELIFHELGHCALNRVHDNNEVSGKTIGPSADPEKEFPRSVMHATLVKGKVYSEFKSYYWKELFRR